MTGDANAIICNGSCQSRNGPAERGQASLKRLFSKAAGGFSSETQGSQQAATYVHEEEDFPLQPLQQQLQLQVLSKQSMTLERPSTDCRPVHTDPMQ